MGLGTWQLYGSKAMDRAVDAAIANNYRLFDSASSYGNEKELGNALQRHLKSGAIRRDDIHITTKINPTSTPNVAKTLNTTLQRLQLDHVDLLLVHRPPYRKEGQKNMWLAVEDMVKAGKARSIGVSNYEISHLEEMKKFASHWPPAVNQIEFHPRINRDALFYYMRENGIFLQAYSSLNPMYPFHYWYLMWEPKVRDMAKKYGVKPPAVLLSYALTLGAGVIPKSTNAEHIRDNYECVFKLTDEDIQQLNTLVKRHH